MICRSHIPFKMVEQIVYASQCIRDVYGFIGSGSQLLVRTDNHLPADKQFPKYTCMIFHMCPRRYARSNPRQIIGAAHFLQSATRGQLTLHREDIYFLSCMEHGLNSGKNHPVHLSVEHLRTQLIGYQGNRLTLHHASANHGFFQIGVLRVQNFFFFHLFLYLSGSIVIFILKHLVGQIFHRLPAVLRIP